MSELLSLSSSTPVKYSVKLWVTLPFLSFMCSTLFAFLASSIIRSIYISVIILAVMVSGQFWPKLSWFWSVCIGEPPGEPERCLFRVSFSCPLPNTPVFFCDWSVVVGIRLLCRCLVSGVVRFRIFVSLGDLMNRPSGLRCPVPPLFDSCTTSEMGSHICFLCMTLFSDVVQCPILLLVVDRNMHYQA